jgi:hypothetical protein
VQAIKENRYLVGQHIATRRSGAPKAFQLRKLAGLCRGGNSSKKNLERSSKTIHNVL